ncbi:MAG TPA: DnaD domain protein [Syntrophomonadaceae bacterium]|nr:DnaD domain protein [Syntrophomonadaceae bacterium]HNX29703.1 DnaD domain protein [Syntrophomonadaceae bacterium]HPR92957.1 DnaD domain protein [Syntrophomonadaceae bacterium]
MQRYSAALEIFRWGNANVPGIIFWYANELDLNMEDIGVLSAIYYAFQKSKPLNQTGVNIGQVINVCPFLTKSKFSRNISRLEKLGIIGVEDKNKSFNEREIYLEPLMEKLCRLVTRDHYQLSEPKQVLVSKAENGNEELNNRIEQLELQLEEERRKTLYVDFSPGTDKNFKKVADFISKKTGNLLSLKMSHELKKWLDEMKYTPEFLLCMLELCFERNIYNPRSISKIACDLQEYSISTVEGLNLYFKKYADTDLSRGAINMFDPEVMEFGNYTGIDMNAEARRIIYYKWKYDWAFTHTMIMKAGEVMCQHTKNGGLEYIDSVLANWKAKNIHKVEEAQKEISEFKNKSKKSDMIGTKKPVTPNLSEYEIFISPVAAEEIKSK